MTQVLFMIIFFIEFVKVCILLLVNLFLFEKMTNHGMTLRFDEIHRKEIGNTEGS